MTFNQALGSGNLLVGEKVAGARHLGGQAGCKVTTLVGSQSCAGSAQRTDGQRERAPPTRASCVPGRAARPATGASTSSTRTRARASGSACAWGRLGLRGAVRGTERADAEAALARALAIAEAQPRVPDAVPLAPEPPARGEWASDFARDPFEVPLEEKLAVLLAADAGLRTEPGVTLTLARFSAFQTETIFASTEGALCEQHVIECGGGIAAVAVRARQPDPLLPRLARRPRGRGRIRALPGAGASGPRAARGRRGRRAAERARCPHERTTLVLAGEQLGLQVHESVGHAVELDRAGARGLLRGHELRAAGRDRLAAVRLRAGERDRRRHDAGRPGELPLGRRGVEGRPVPIVRDGVLAGFLSRARPPRRSGSSAPAAACAPTASRASRSCG